MTQKITAKKIRSISRLVRDALGRPETEFDPMEHPYAVTATYFSGEIPEEHWLTENHDRRAYSTAARNGWFEVQIIDATGPDIPVARAAFTESKGAVIAERLAVDRPYRGMGFGQQMLDLGGRLWGGPVEGADAFRDQDEVFWNSPKLDDAA